MTLKNKLIGLGIAGITLGGLSGCSEKENREDWQCVKGVITDRNYISTGGFFGTTMYEAEVKTFQNNLNIVDTEFRLLEEEAKAANVYLHRGDTIEICFNDLVDPENFYIKKNGKAIY